MEIAILAGGDSSEYSISVKSGIEIKKWLEKAGFSSHLVIVKGKEWQVKNGKEHLPFDKEFFGFTQNKSKIKCDYVWNIIHGSPGEDGKLQGYLDMMKIPYNCSELLSSALSFNKFVAKNYLRQYGIRTAEAELVQRKKPFDIEEIVEKVGLPCFIKPNNGGSSFGTTKVSQIENMQAAINSAFKEDNEVIIESFVKGRELTCGLYKTEKKEVIFPLTEIVSKTEFFDYDAKYKGQSDEITPADIEDDLMKKCKNISSAIYDYLNCKGLVRVDYIIKGNQIYFLEINTVPGMTKESIVPQQILAADLQVEDVLKDIIIESENLISH